MNKPPLHRVLLFSLLVLITGLGYWNEKIPVNNQTGWDGKHYANLSIHFEELAVQKQIDSYQYQRMLTPAVIHYTARLLGMELNEHNIVSVFYLYNCLLILLCALIFFHLCTFLNCSVSSEIIGFSALFLNYFILKNTSYYPVLTDITAFFGGMCLVSFFIRQKNLLIWLTVIIGQFCYPLFLIISAPLALAIRNNSFARLLKQFRVFAILAVLVIILVSVGFYQILFVPDAIIPKYKMELNTFMLPLSILVVWIYLWRSINTFTYAETSGNDIPKIIEPLAKLLCLVAFVSLVNYVINKISIPEEVFTPIVFINNLLQQSIDNPAVFLVSHIIYLGPAIVLVLFLYKPFIQTVTTLGDSAILYCCLILVFSIGSETRQFIHFYPFIIVVLMITLNQHPVSTTKAICFAVLSLFASKCWFPINTPQSFTDYAYTEFPNQRYFMNHGPFMSDLSYYINVVIVGSEMALVRLLFFRNKPLQA